MTMRDEAGFWLCSKCTDSPAGFCESCAHNHALIRRLTGKADIVLHLKGLVESYRAAAFKASWERMVLLNIVIRMRLAAFDIQDTVGDLVDMARPVKNYDYE